jgi:hypothetical protein
MSGLFFYTNLISILNQPFIKHHQTVWGETENFPERPHFSAKRIVNFP